MAKTCTVNRNEKRKRMSEHQFAKREELKAIIKDESKSFEERMAARDKLNAMPRDGSYVRVRLRCAMTGRPRGNYKKFGLCRNQIRKLAAQGLLPGLRKGSL
ncbi:MAG: 30S ribosomal protein S14 [Pseudomonadaceae bacterium]|nr:30S ribosomal protein S14 [Pseudomonadaceae bacterium]